MSAETKPVPTACFGLQDRRETAAQMNVGVRTVRRWEEQGLPVIVVGARRLHDPASVRAWLLGRERKREAPRRGRPPIRT